MGASRQSWRTRHGPRGGRIGFVPSSAPDGGGTRGTWARRGPCEGGLPLSTAALGLMDTPRPGSSPHGDAAERPCTGRREKTASCHLSLYASDYTESLPDPSAVGCGRAQPPGVGRSEKRCHLRPAPSELRPDARRGPGWRCTRSPPLGPPAARGRRRPHRPPRACAARRLRSTSPGQPGSAGVSRPHAQRTLSRGPLALLSAQRELRGTRGVLGSTASLSLGKSPSALG